MQQITTALLSYGMSGRVFHAPFIEGHPGFILAGSWERSKKQIQLHYPNVKSYNSVDDVLQDPAVELVIVNTPTYTHFELAKRALEANKHVVVEKAFTTSLAEAIELSALAKAKDKKLSVFQNRRWDSDFRTVESIIKRGVLGDLVEVSISYDRYNPQLSPKLHKEKKGPGAGVVYDLGPHLIDQAIYLFGFPVSVFATIAITREQSEVDDFFEILLFYPKFIVRLKSGYFVKEPVPSFIVNGKHGTFLKSRADGQEIALQKGEKPDSKNYGIEAEQEYGLLHTEWQGKIVREKVESLKGDYMQYYNGIYEAIVSNETVPVTAEDGVRVMKIIEAAFQSHNEKRIIALT